MTVSSGSFIDQSGSVVSYAGGSILTTASTSNLLWLTDAGILTQGTAWPAANHLKLATVVTGASSITSVSDARVVCRSSGFAGLTVKETGAAARLGRAVLSAGSAIVSTTAVTAASEIFLTGQVDGGTPGWLRVSARTPGTSFTIASSSGADTSSVAWVLIEPA